MRKPIKTFIKFFFVLIVPLLLTKELCANVPLTVRYDSSDTYAHRSFDSKALQEYKSDPDFSYVINHDVNQGYEFNWLAKLLDKLFGISFNKDTAIIWEIVLYLFAGGVFILVLWQLLQADKSWFMNRSSRNAKIKIEEIEQNIHEMDLDQLIKEAIEQKQYRKAVRLLYLKSLKELNKKNLINWSIQKTNSDYLDELKGAPLKKSFKNVTLIFEYIWYGDFHIDETLLHQVKVSFDNFMNEIERR